MTLMTRLYGTVSFVVPGNTNLTAKRFANTAKTELITERNNTRAIIPLNFGICTILAYCNIMDHK